MTIHRTKYPTTGFLLGKVIEIPAGTRCTPVGDGSFFAEDWHTYGIPRGSFDDWDAEHHGIRIQGVHVE